MLLEQQFNEHTHTQDFQWLAAAIFRQYAGSVALPPQQQPGVYKGVGNNNFNEIIRRRLGSACCWANNTRGISYQRCMLLHHLRVVADQPGVALR